MAPEIVPFAFADIYEGESSQVFCALSKGDDPVRLEWYHGTKLLTAARQDVTVMPTGPRASVLVFNSLKASHFGNYSCQASNAAGSSSFTAQLIING